MYLYEGLILGSFKNEDEEKLLSLSFTPFLKYLNEMLNAMNADDCEEEHEKIDSNAAWSDNLYL